MSAGNVVDSVTGPTSAAEEAAVTAETEAETHIEEEMTRGIAADRLQGMVVDAAEATQERLRDVRDDALDASSVDTSRHIALREAVGQVATTETQGTIAMEAIGAEMTEAAMEEMNLAAITREVALLPEEVIGITNAPPLGTGALPTTVVTIATTAEAPLVTTNERWGRMH